MIYIYIVYKQFMTPLHYIQWRRLECYGLLLFSFHISYISIVAPASLHDSAVKNQIKILQGIYFVQFYQPYISSAPLRNTNTQW